MKQTTSKSDKIPENEPKDKYNLVYLSFFFLGVVHILPWTFFLTANEYWMYKFRNTSITDSVSSETRTQLQTEFFSALNITLQVSDVVFLFVMLFLGHKFRVAHKMIASVFIIFLLFVVSMIFIKINTDSWQMVFFVMSMIFVAIINAMNSVFGMTMYSILSTFPDSYLAPYINGQGLAGIFSATLQLLSLTIGVSTETSALVYFGLGVLVNGFTVLLLVATMRSEFYQYFISQYKNEKGKMMGWEEAKRVLKKMWPSLSIMLLWILTVNPVQSSITSLVTSESEGMNQWGDLYFVPTASFLLPAIADFVGRALGSKTSFGLGGTSWTVITGVRMLVFVPLVMLCNAKPRHHLPVVFSHDYQYIIIMLIFSLSNGYLLSLCSIIIPTLVLPDEQETAYHLYMVGTGLELGAFSFLGMVSVKML